MLCELFKKNEQKTNTVALWHLLQLDSKKRQLSIVNELTHTGDSFSFVGYKVHNLILNFNIKNYRTGILLLQSPKPLVHCQGRIQSVTNTISTLPSFSSLSLSLFSLFLQIPSLFKELFQIHDLKKCHKNDQNCFHQRPFPQSRKDRFNHFPVIGFAIAQKIVMIQ